jgi:hypothetical protein
MLEEKTVLVEHGEFQPSGKLCLVFKTRSVINRFHDWERNKLKPKK